MASSAMKSVLLLAMLLCTLAVAAASTAEASHILVKDEAKITELKEKITTAADTLATFKVRPRQGYLGGGRVRLRVHSARGGLSKYRVGPLSST